MTSSTTKYLLSTPRLPCPLTWFEEWSFKSPWLLAPLCSLQCVSRGMLFRELITQLVHLEEGLSYEAANNAKTHETIVRGSSLLSGLLSTSNY